MATRVDPGERAVDAPPWLAALVCQAERLGASDIHLQMNGREAAVAFRLDGVLTPQLVIRDPLAERVVGRIKFLARLKTYQDALPQDGRIAGADLGVSQDVRVATYPTVTGEKIVLRLFSQSAPLRLVELGLTDEPAAAIEQFLRQTSGMMLLTGPAGSGKTTLIYACLRELQQQGGRQVITIEDPVESLVPGIMQTEINEARGLDFAAAARHLLRQDPEVLVIGEIRDEATANLAMRAALTGHLVIATLHAGSCRGVFERLLMLCTDHSSLWSTVELVLNQRLLRRVCAACQGRGCDQCAASGYRGRVAVVEWLRLDETLRRRAIVEGTTALAPKISLREAAHALESRGVTNAAELARLALL